MKKIIIAMTLIFASCSHHHHHHHHGDVANKEHIDWNKEHERMKEDHKRAIELFQWFSEHLKEHNDEKLMSTKLLSNLTTIIKAIL